ncbi:MAG TPA: MFS transporter, partial [Nocardioides sp.]
MTSMYSRLVRTEGDQAPDLAEDAVGHVERNGLRQMGGQAMQGIGDQVVNAKTVLPWLLGAVGAPGGMLALLVPIRESGSMLPQAPLTSWVRRLRARKWAWAAGAGAQAVATAAMALAALAWEGWAAGIAILIALAVFALGRALCSLASKDVLGRTIPKGQRGQINGVVTVLSGAVALTLGLALEVWGGDVDAGLLAVLLLAAATTWVVGLVMSASGSRRPNPTTRPRGRAGRRRPGTCSATTRRC